MYSPFPTSGIPLSLVASGLFWLAVLITIVVSIMLYYHWIRYGVGIVGTFLVMVVYAAGTAVLLLAALGLLTQL